MQRQETQMRMTAGKNPLDWWNNKIKFGFWHLAFKMHSYYKLPCLYQPSPFLIVFHIFIVLSAYIKENKLEWTDTNPELLEHVMAYICWMFGVLCRISLLLSSHVPKK